MAVVGVVVAGMVALPSTATATPIHACIATIGLTGTTGIGVTTKQWRSTNPLIGEKSVRRARLRPRGGTFTDQKVAPIYLIEQDARFVVRDHGGQALAYVYFEDEPGRRSAAKIRTVAAFGWPRMRHLNGHEGNSTYSRRE
jgi:hypothetical protein